MQWATEERAIENFRTSTCTKLVELKLGQYTITFCKANSELRIQRDAKNHNNGVNVDRGGKFKDDTDETKGIGM